VAVTLCTPDLLLDDVNEYKVETAALGVEERVNIVDGFAAVNVNVGDWLDLGVYV
jgi:hypothetical protein